MIIVTFSGPEEQVVEKIKAVLVEDHEIECISIVDGKEMTFGDVEIRTKQRKVFFKGKEVEMTSREFDVLYTLAYYHDQVLTTRQIYKAITGEDAPRTSGHFVPKWLVAVLPLPGYSFSDGHSFFKVQLINELP